MFVNLFKWFSVMLPFPVWVLTILLILLWWGITWGIAKLCINGRVRSGKVIFSTQMVIFWVGAIFIFNVTLVPIVLIAFHGMALFALWICGITAILYFIRVSGKDSGIEGSRRRSSPAPVYGKNDDPFK